MYQFFLIIFIIIAVILIVLIMFQQNKSNNFGGVFDNRSLGNILNSSTLNDGITRVIVILAVLFFLFSLLLGNINSKQNKVYILDSHREHQKKILKQKN